MDISFLPTVNACLNTMSAGLLVLGYGLIRKGIVNGHKACMLTACLTSTLFLASYLYYHYHHGTTVFTGQGWVRPVYFTILISHTLLAAAIVPLVAVTLALALKGRFGKHAAWARITLPVWLYVSVTGVVIYRMLYH